MKGQFYGKGAVHCKVYGHTAMIRAKTAEPILAMYMSYDVLLQGGAFWR